MKPSRLIVEAEYIAQYLNDVAMIFKHCIVQAA